jgi:acyl dehydratase
MDDKTLKQWRDKVVGKVTGFSVGVIDPLWSQRYAVAVDDLDPAYFDEDAAKARGLKGMIAPPNYLATLRATPVSGPTEAGLLPDGMSPEARPDVPGLQIMGGGQSLAFHEPVYCGQTIAGEKSVKSISKREGKSGPLIIVEEEIIYRNENDTPVLTLLNRSIFRPIGGADQHD